MWWTFSILVWATVPPTMHQNFDTVVLPVPYATEQQCKDGVTWLNANTPRAIPPSPNTRQVYACVFIPAIPGV